MDERTRAALEGSIEKWRAIEAGHGPDNGILNCPLCKLFYPLGCDGCPVKAATGSGYCGNSPHDYWSELRFEVETIAGHEIDCIDEAPLDEAPRLKRAARDEREFLESLLPEAPPPPPS